MVSITLSEPTDSFADPRAGSAPLLFDAPFLIVRTGDYPSAFAQADFNGDGALDLVVACWSYPRGRLVLLPGRGDGTFEDFVTIATTDIGWGPIVASDLNQDGKVDLAVLDSGSYAHILLGNGDGSFTSRQVISLPERFAHVFIIAADLNQDGNSDLAISGSDIYVLPGVGDGMFGQGYSLGADTGASGLAVSDFDGNGVPDIAVANYNTRSLSILFGTGSGQFTSPTNLPAGFGPVGIAVADVNGDRNLDVAVANGGWYCNSNVVVTDSTVTIYLGDGLGHFVAAPSVIVGNTPWMLSLSDVNSDDIPDLVVGNALEGGGCFFSNLASSLSSNSSPAPGLSALIGNGDGTFGPAPAFNSREAGTAVSVEDLNGDGLGDLIAVHGYHPDLSVFLANPDGSYGGGQELPTDAVPQHLLTADLNGDGLEDVAVACWESGTVNVALGKTGRHLGPVLSSPAGDHPTFLASGDFDKDGKRDLVVADFGDADTSFQVPRIGALSVLQGNGNGTFTRSGSYSTGGNVNCVRVGDLNQDGRPDLVAGTFSPPLVSVLLGGGDGTFSATQSYPLQGSHLSAMTLGDFDHDGYLDVAASVAWEGISLLRGKGDGTLAASAVIAPNGVFALETADANLDSLPDLLRTPGYPGSFKALLSRGDGTFADPPAATEGPQAYGILGEDFNGDGMSDVATSNWDQGSASVYIGTGTGYFTRRVDYAVGYKPTAIAAGDLNGDGRPDLAVANSGSNSLSLLWNRGEALPFRLARAFLQAAAVSAAPTGPATCFRVEPLNRSYLNRDVYPPSLYLECGGTGLTDRIRAIPQDLSIEADQDGDGIAELSVCFASEDVSRLFENVKGMRTVKASLVGATRTGETFLAQVQFRVVGVTGGLRTYLASSPSHGGDATLLVTTTRFGNLTVKLYDVRGRLVRTLLDERFEAAGVHAAGIDGTGKDRLPSGLYFYKVEASEGIRTGKVAILH